MVRTHRLQTVRIEQIHPLGKGIAQPVKGSVQQHLRSPVILVQHNAPGIIILLILAQHELRMGAPPFVNGLEVIPAQQQMTGPKNLRDYAVFQKTGILHLVNIDVDKAPSPFGSHTVLTEEFIHLHQQIGKVQTVELMQPFIIKSRRLRSPLLPAFKQPLMELVAVIQG